jgi:DNA-binding SARP family transcriptional activator
MYTILKSKLRPPPAGWPVLERAPALLRLDAATADPALRVLVFTAAAGYGKTTLLAEWTRRLGRHGVPVAWYGLGPGDRALAIFCAYLEAALRASLPGFDAALARLREVGEEPATMPPPPGDLDPDEIAPDEMMSVVGLVTPLLAALDTALPPSTAREAGRPRLVIVLDDVHHIAGQRLLDTALGFLIRHLPAGVVLALTARRDLGRGLPLARLRQGRQVVSLHEPDLRLLAAEVARAYPELTAWTAQTPALEALLRQLEGWPAGIAILHDHLAEAGAGSNGALDGALIARRVREDLYTYLDEEVLSSVTEPLYSFLLRVAVLRDLTPPACDALTALTGSEILLTQAMHNHLFLSRSPADPTFYTFHPLFCDFLLHRLAQMYGASERRRLHRTAASYAAGNGAWPIAAYHFLASEDLDAVLMALEMTQEPGPEGVPATDPAVLGATLRTVDDPLVRRRLVEALGRRARLAELPLVDAFADDPDPAVRASAQAARILPAQQASGLLRIQMFGGLRVAWGETLVDARAWRRRRARLLLIYLLLAGPEGVSRTEIAEKVWPEARPSEALAQFYAHLRALRAVLEPGSATGTIITSCNGRYTFNFSIPHQWDLADFQQHRDAGRRAARLGQVPAAIAAYQAALACAQGPLLPEGDLANVPWLVALRTACREDVLALHSSMGEYAAAAGAWEDAIGHWQALLAAAPDREDIHARLMMVYGWLGRREEARAQFQVARAALLRSYGAEPGPVLTTLYQQIMAGARTPAPESLSPPLA